MGLKATAYLLTGSVGLLSDAMESGINLVAAFAALIALSVAAQPPDAEHAYGHSKAEYFSSALEGGLILLAAVTIVATGVERLLHPRELQQLDLGIGVAVLASLFNLATAVVLRRAGRAYESATLEADAQHLLSDVWTTAGVVVGVGATWLTGWQPLDPIVAIIVGVNIGWTSVGLVRSAMAGLMDTALPPEEQAIIYEVLEKYSGGGVQFHAVRTRRAGAQRFVSFHVLVPGALTVQQGHDLLEEIEQQIRASLPRTSVFTHIEPLEDPSSWNDPLIREEAGRN
ncbi:MAG: cation transporter [Chloroflexi bacterium]|jgi:cation diffusion facilitator family transporter|nr:cation transporter [Chloroflexota bacterium]